VTGTLRLVLGPLVKQWPCFEKIRFDPSASRSAVLCSLSPLFAMRPVHARIERVRACVWAGVLCP
jgi:hypothetical protein